MALPLKIVVEVSLPIPQDKADSNKIIVFLCQTANELNKKIKCLMIGAFLYSIEFNSSSLKYIILSFFGIICKILEISEE